MISGILHKVRRFLSKPVLGLPLWVLLLTLVGVLIARKAIATLLMYGAAVGILLSAISLIAGGKNAKSWAKSLLIYSVVLELIALLLKNIF